MPARAARCRSSRASPHINRTDRGRPPTFLEVRLEARPHLMRQELQARRVHEQQRYARDLVDGALDARLRRIRGAEYVLDLAGTVAERILSHRLQLGHDRRPVTLLTARRRRWRRR